jgi:quercetin dioxygenase-like cupin family protein
LQTKWEKQEMKQDGIEVRKWPYDPPPDEAAIRKILSTEGLKPYCWSNSPGDVYSAHSHAFHKVIYVMKGSMTFGLPDTGDQVQLYAGDRLDLSAGVSHNAVVGNDGVACLEAHR